MRTVDSDKDSDALRFNQHGTTRSKNSTAEQIAGRSVRLIRFKDVKDGLAIVSLDKDSKSEDDSANLRSDALAFVVYDSNEQLQKAIASWTSGRTSVVRAS